MQDAGRLRHKLVLQQYDGTVDSLGDVRLDDDANWDTVATVWAAVDPISGKEFYANEQAGTSLTHKVTIRYRAGVRPGQRFLLGARKLAIESVIDWQERHEHMLLMCREVV